MDIRNLTERYAVSPQIAPEHAEAIRDAGFTTVIDNRPDNEVPPELRTEALRRAIESAGLTFIANPVVGGAITMENVTAQGEAVAASKGPVLAYCASGNRSSIVWALSEAGQRPTDELIRITQRWGYNLEPFRPQIDALANSA
ncbi:Beta-lactamase hydrolase-like protein [Defluviimonas aquaemixtae]|uniref:Beta-lactamase hydrolase-like protein n=1 Tax=Albidovulum aquaemixtae TaxID=1542388 RepID=A0A2R8B4B2_9RHOB|nr:TIGR01244 family sulfur transferase [Defluviimonas aquaemixtae]SPH17449.1 Beta-lactamase hydrolase-like protein [Defluviimonas aquaemixtae]